VAKRIGILTGGGDCPGLNAAIRAVARRSISRGSEVVGFEDGWKGLLERTTRALEGRAISGILAQGGTILGTSRTNPYTIEGGVDTVAANLSLLGVDALIVVGGEGTLAIAARLYEERELPVVGIPKTIDNDVSATDYTIGFDTAVAICTEAIDRLHTAAESQNRVMVAEVMGRHAGWIAAHSGIASGADLILIPEKTMPIDEVCELLDRRHRGGKDFSIVVVAEGYELEGLHRETEVDQFGHIRLGLRGVGHHLARMIEEKTGFETRVTALGYMQRGGTPTARDRVLATRFGLKAADLAHAGRFGRMAALHGDEIVDVPLADAAAPKTVPPEWYEVAAAFFG